MFTTSPASNTREALTTAAIASTQGLRDPRWSPPRSGSSVVYLMAIRKLIFWLHLIAGVAAGIVILIMCITGVLLTYEKQIVAWSDRDYLAESPTHGAPRVPIDTLISAISRASGTTPTTITYYAHS